MANEKEREMRRRHKLSQKVGEKGKREEEGRKRNNNKEKFSSWIEAEKKAAIGSSRTWGSVSSRTGWSQAQHLRVVGITSRVRGNLTSQPIMLRMTRVRTS